MNGVRPNFLFIGPDKAGSTWLYEAMSSHSQCALSSAKELFFFDRFYSRGWRWYEQHFPAEVVNGAVVGEISHDYLFSDDAAERIARDLPDARLMVCLREPCKRAFSAWLYMIRQGRTRLEFPAAIDSIHELIDHGCYATHLQRYLDRFDRRQIHVAVFDDLSASPQRFFDEVCVFLGIETRSLPESLTRQVLPAAAPRSFLVAGLARSTGWGIRSLGLPALVGRIKRSPLVSKLLYRSYREGERPELSVEDEQRLREVFDPEVRALDEMLGMDLADRWGYSAEPAGRLSQSVRC